MTTRSSESKRETAVTVEVTGKRWCPVCACLRNADGGYLKLVKHRGGGLKKQWRCELCRKQEEERKR